MNAWKIFESDLIIQMPLILAGLVDTLKLAGFISVTGLLLGIVVFYLTLRLLFGLSQTFGWLGWIILI